MIRQTSLKAYKEQMKLGSFRTQMNTIYNYLFNSKEPKSRNDLSRDLGISINAVCGRVRKLIDLDLIEEKGLKKDQKTGKANYVLGVVGKG